jgi:hypothetical protein
VRRAGTCSCSGGGASLELLELHEAGGAFEALDAYLEDEGSGGRDGVVADPYDPRASACRGRWAARS